MNPADQINQNFLHHATFLQSRTAGMNVMTTEAFTFSDSGLSCDTFNIVYITDGSKITKEAFKNVIDHYEQKNFAFCVWVNEENLTEAVKEAFYTLQLAEAASEPGMALALEAYQPGVFSGVIKKLENQEELNAYAHLLSLNWQPPDVHVQEYYARTGETILGGGHSIEYFSFYQDGIPVSVIEVFPSDDETAGIYNLCTLKEYRGTGIATNLLRFCLDRLKKKGYKTAILQASDDGLNIYKKLGFSVQTRFFEFTKG